MTCLTFADLMKQRTPLSPSEAAALTAAAARALANQRGTRAGVRQPDARQFLLSSTGAVSVGSVEEATEREEISGLATLLQRLLRLDRPGVQDKRGHVPGGLMVLLARALKQIDAPAPDREEFTAALHRFSGDADAAAGLASIFWRVAGVKERRAHGLSRAELRRSVRDLERELFEQRAAAPATASGTQERRAGVAAALIAALLLAMLGSGMMREESVAMAEPAPPAAVAGPVATPVDASATAVSPEAAPAPAPVAVRRAARRPRQAPPAAAPQRRARKELRLGRFFLASLNP